MTYADGRDGYPCRGGFAEFGELLAKADVIRISHYRVSDGTRAIELSLWTAYGRHAHLARGASWDLVRRPPIRFADLLREMGESR